MGKLHEFLKKLPRPIQRRFGIDEIPGVLSDAERLAAETPPAEEIVALAGDVLETVASKGMTAIQADGEKVEALLLEGFLYIENPAAPEPGMREIRTWAEYVELRGYIRGFRAKRTLAGGILRAGAQAELRVESADAQKRRDRRRTESGAGD